MSVFEQIKKLIAKIKNNSYFCALKQGPRPHNRAKMLLKFSVTNFRSFGKEMTLDLLASNGIKDLKGNGVTVIGSGPSSFKVVNGIAIYGANSSGKSNLLSAMKTMKRMVMESVRLNDNESLHSCSPRVNPSLPVLKLPTMSPTRGEVSMCTALNTRRTPL